MIPRIPLRHSLRRSVSPLAGAMLLALPCTVGCQSPLPVDQIRLPPGFTISVVARVPSARAMTMGPGGTLFVGSASAGGVHAVVLPASGTGDAVVRTIATGLRESYCHGGTIADPEFGGKRACSEFEPPAQNLGPHVAALGMRFYTGTQFPAVYRSQIFIAEHGSWNRSRKIGYRVTLVTLDAAGKPTRYEPFAEGWLDGGRVWGRPADVLVAPDGSLLVSDDYAGAIYRIRYRGA